jgi:uncharacterized protein (TIGR03032 family)
MQKPSPPFSCRYSPNFPELLSKLNCTIALSTYQAGKLLLISAQDDEKVIQLPRNFLQAMAIGIDSERMAVATKDEVDVLANAPGLAPQYPKQPNVYDGFFAPRATYYTGRVDIHGLGWGEDGLWAVITSFSCLALIDDAYSFIPKWKPFFITNLASEDRCHLNGMAMSEGAPLYATALGSGNEHQGWRKNLPKGGVLIQVPTGEIILSDLSMPHSPRIYDGKLYMLFSATGEVVCVDTEKGSYEVINKLSGFIRGMARCEDYLFICLSRLRKNSSTFKDLPIAEKATSSGVSVIHLPTGAIVARLTYESSVDEIFDIQIIPGMRRPGILNTQGDTYKLALTTPDTTYWAAVGKNKK